MAAVGVVVPALDAAATLPAVLAELRAALPDATIIGVDDGSSDGTHDALSAACDVVLRFPRNRGKGAALRAGFEVALAQGLQSVVTIDADGQHDPRCAPQLVAALDDADVAIGARARLGTAMPLRRRLSNALSSAIVTSLAGCPIADAQCGYRAIRAEVLRCVQAEGDRYEFETDFLIRVGRAGFRVAAVPIPTLYGGASHFREVRDAVRVIGTIWRSRRLRRVAT